VVKTWVRLEQVLWALFGLLLPVTSLPLIDRLGGSDMVAPASGLVLLILIAVSVLPRWLRGSRLSRASIPLLAFSTAALAPCVLAFFVPVPPFREHTVLKSEINALATLALGMAFYLAVQTWSTNEERAARLLRWINAGGLLTVLWTLAQTAAWRLGHDYPDWMQSLHSLISTHELYQARATGLAFEPSWLAHQLNLLYLPLWAGAALSGSSAHHLRWRFITVERVLLMGGLLALLLSVSRVGLLAPLLCGLLLGAQLAWRAAHWLQVRIMLRNRTSGLRRALINGLVWLGLAVLFLLAALGLFGGAAYGLSRYDPRMRTMFDFSNLTGGSFKTYANQLVFAERVIFWEAGWLVFNDHPWMGVGLGNAGFYFPDKLSAYSWGLTEVRAILLERDALPNAKSLWVRLAAETGLVGTALFLGWLYVCAGLSTGLRKEAGIRSVLGWAGLFFLCALLSEGFSLDTFALPYLWMIPALVAGLSVPAQPAA
jgi:O-antigen ligase